MKTKNATENHGQDWPERKRYAHLERFFATASTGLCLIDPELRYLRINEALAVFSDQPASELVGKALHEVMPSFAAKVEPVLRKVIETGQPAINFELCLPTRAEPELTKWWLLSFHPLKAESGAVVAVGAIVEDVSHCKQAEEALGERLRFEALLADLSAAFIDLPASEIQRRIRHGLEKIVEFLGVERCTVMEFSEDKSILQVTDTYATDGVPGAPSGFRLDEELPWITEQLRHGRIISISRVPDDFPAEAVKDRQFFSKAGFKSVLTFPLTAGGLTMGGIGFGAFHAERGWPEDIVSRFQLVGEVFANALIRKQTGEKLAAEEQFSDSVIESLPGLFFMVDDRFEYLRWNRNTEKILGYSAAEMKSRLILEIIAPADRDRVAEAMRRALQGETAKCEFHILTRDGREIPYIGSIRQAGIAGSNYLIGVEIDISRRKEAEAATRRAFSEIEQLKEQLEAECYSLREEIKLEHNFENIIGQSDALKYVLFKVEQVAPTDATVLLLGETGTGKELVARAIHDASPRRERPLVKVNCAALPADLIESELFGHEKGAFTSADSVQIGRFEIADGATIFLDEIGELPLKLQAKLLRALQDGEFERLGSPRTIKADARVIAATNRNLEEEVGQGRFREDLWYRLNVFPITVPPLRKRPEDIPLLVQMFVDKFGKKMGKQIDTVPQGAMDNLKKYSWPGNVRELENVIERAVIHATGSTLRLAAKLEAPRKRTRGDVTEMTLQDVERAHILAILEAVHWRIEGEGGAADILGLNPSTLRGRMRKLRIHRPR